MKGLSKVLNESDNTVDSFCISNTSRPLLSVGTKGGKGARRTYLYVEALRKFPEELKRVDYTEAYKKARPMYNGRMERTFVVLKEEGTQGEQFSGGNREPLGKRPLDDPLSGGEPSKRPALSQVIEIN